MARCQVRLPQSHHCGSFLLERLHLHHFLRTEQACPGSGSDSVWFQLGCLCYNWTGLRFGDCSSAAPWLLDILRQSLLCVIFSSFIEQF